MNLAFVYGYWTTGPNGPFDIDKLYEEKGLTGSESFFFNSARGMAELGHKVTVYCVCVNEIESAAKLGGATVKHLSRILAPGSHPASANPVEGFDVALSWNEPDYLTIFKGSKHVCIQQLNDFQYVADKNFNSYVDLFAFPSEHHMNFMVQDAGLDPSRCTVFSNSINLEFYDGEEVRDPHQMVYCSSPDRGLHWLLGIFPQVRKAVPDAKLNIYYKVIPWYERIKNIWDPNDSTIHPLANRARYIKECLDRLGVNGENGVTLVGPTPNKVMARELMKAGVFTYPCDTVRYTEGYSVSILDACAAGCVPVISDRDAIGSVYKGVAHILPGPVVQKTWVDVIVTAMTDPAFRAPILERTKAFVPKQSRQVRATQLQGLLERLCHS